MKLLDHHLLDLRGSGLTDATIDAAGCYSETDAGKLAILLRHKGPGKTKKCAPAIVFPFTGLDGKNGYHRVKWDRPPEKVDRKSGGKKKEKYASPCELPNQPYFPPGIAAKIESAEQELILTEGEKKALKATQEGFPTIGLTGVWAWKPKDREQLLPELEQIIWKGRRVFIAFDSDRTEKADIQKAEARLAFHLAKRGAIVKLVILPPGPLDAEGRPTKIGLDDFLVANNAEALRKLLDEAIDPTPPDAIEQKRPAQGLDPCEEVQAIIEAESRDGVATIRFWRGTFWRWKDGRYIELSTKEVTGKLVERLNESACNLTRSIVANHMMQMEAQTMLSGHIDAPAWLGDKPGPWPANEVLACRNGLVHLPSYLASSTRGPEAWRRPASPTFFNTAAMGFDFNPDAGMPAEWQKFLSGLWEDDHDSAETLREFFGYALTPDTSQQKILMLVGPPRSGKGTIARVLRELVGRGNVAGPTLSSLGTNFGLWPIVGKTLAIVSDARLGGRSDIVAVTERLLSISGEDALTIDRKNLEPVTCTLPTRFVILTNELPRFTDSSGALASRMIVLRLTKSFLGSEDHQLTTRLLEELPSILLWSIIGWNRLRQRGYFEEPAASADMRQQLDDLTSPIKVFIRERCKVGSQYCVVRSDLYAAYKEWCEAVGRDRVEDNAGFGRALIAAVPSITGGQRRVNGEQMRFYNGIGLLMGV